MSGSTSKGAAGWQGAGAGANEGPSSRCASGRGFGETRLGRSKQRRPGSVGKQAGPVWKRGVMRKSQGRTQRRPRIGGGAEARLARACAAAADGADYGAAV